MRRRRRPAGRRPAATYGGPTWHLRKGRLVTGSAREDGELTSRRRTAWSWWTAAACVVWFGAVVLAVTPGPLAATIGILFALLGVWVLAVCHERRSGGRWITGVAIAALPGIALFVSPVVADEGGAVPALVVVGLASLLVVVSMSVAARVQRRLGDAPDTGGDSNFYG